MEKESRIYVQQVQKPGIFEKLGSFIMMLTLGLPIFFIGLLIGFFMKPKKSEEKE